ncbi:MAG: hypothetical protein NTY22_01695, partial [Proteobacteria bacterium]|nr:hypothetical protein [Pseudomonadota bacterium]
MRVYFNVKGKEENPYLEKFIRHYVKYKRINLKNITIEAIEESNKSSPDYYIKELNLLVEVKRVVNREETEESAKYNQFTLKLKKILEQRVIGQYMISIPFFYSTSKGKQISKIADEIDKAIKNNLNECSVEQLGKVKINTISKKGAGVCFSTHSQPTFRNPPQEVHKNIENSLKKANKQLASHKFRKKKCQKILLFVNHYRLFDHKWQFIEALTYSYKKLLTYPNINFIWILKGEKTDPELIYSRDFL